MNIDHVLSEYNVFVTGASGFIGTVLLRRLLNVENGGESKIFCLLRAGRKFGSVSERMRREILSNEIMGLSESAIDELMLKQRVVAVEGDVTEDLLGLDPKTLSTLKHSHSGNGKKGVVMIHCAADIDFNRELNRSIEINVNGSYQCVRVGQEVSAKAFIHISTLYVNSREHRDQLVEERVYQNGLDFVSEFEQWLLLKEQGEGFDAEHIAAMKAVTSPTDPLQRSEWPNSYTFTKNMAENVVLHHCGGKGSGPAIPCSIVRLGIVSPMSSGEHLGWFMGNGGFVFLVIGIATGNIRYLHGDGKGRPDFVPVDYTVDTIMAVAARTASGRGGGADIFQCGVIDNDPSWTVTECFDFIRPRFLAQDLPYCLEAPSLSFIESKALLTALEVMLYEVPLFVLGVAAQLLSVCSLYFWYKLYWRASGLRFEMEHSDWSKCSSSDGPSDSASSDSSALSVEEEIRSLEVALLDKPYGFVKRVNFMKRARGKMKWFDRNYSFFVNQRWRFDHSNVKALFQSLDADSRRKYQFDVDRLSFNQYAFDAALVCFRKYIAYRDDKKQSRLQLEAVLEERVRFLKERRRAKGERSLSADERKQIVDVVRKLFFMIGLDYKLTVGIVVAMAAIAAFSFLCGSWR